MDLLFLTDVSQVDQIAQNEPVLFERMTLVTGDIAVAAELERRQIPFLEEWSYLSAEDIERNWNEAHDLTAMWWQDGFAGCGDMSYESFSLADAAQEMFITPFEAGLNARTVYGRLLREHAPDHLFGYFLPPVAVTRGGPLPAERAVASIAQAVLFWTAEQRGIPVTRNRQTHPLSNAMRARSTASRSAKRTGNVPEIAPIPLSSRDHGRTVVIIQPGMPNREYEALVRRFQKESGWNLVSLSNIDFAAGPFAEHHHQQTLQRLDRAWRSFESTQQSYTGAYPELFANSHLRFQFRQVWEELAGAVRRGTWFSAFLDAVTPSLIVLGHDSFVNERVFVKLARSRKVPTAALLHGGFSPVGGFRAIAGDADYILVWNDIDIELMTSFGVDRRRLSKVGAIRYSTEPGSRDSNRGCLVGSNRMEEARTTLSLPAQKQVVTLLTGAVNTGLSAPAADPPVHRTTMRAFCAMAARLPDISFVIKPHPTYDHFEFYRRLVRTGPANLHFLEDAALDVVIEASDICLLANYCTTAALEVMIAGVPLVFITEGIYKVPSRRPSLPANGALVLASMPDFEAVLPRLLEQSEYGEHAATLMKEALSMVLDHGDRPATERAFAELDRIASAGKTRGPDCASDSSNGEEAVFTRALAGLLSLARSKEDETAVLLAFDTWLRSTGDAAFADDRREQSFISLSYALASSDRTPRQVRRIVLALHGQCVTNGLARGGGQSYNPAHVYALEIVRSVYSRSYGRAVWFTAYLLAGHIGGSATLSRPLAKLVSRRITRIIRYRIRRRLLRAPASQPCVP